MIRIIDTAKKQEKWKTKFALLPKKFITCDNVIFIFIWLSRYQVRYFYDKPNDDYYLDHHSVRIDRKVYRVLHV